MSRHLTPTKPGARWALLLAIAIYVVMLGFAYAVHRGWLG